MCSSWILHCLRGMLMEAQTPAQIPCDDAERHEHGLPLHRQTLRQRRDFVFQVLPSSVSLLLELHQAVAHGLGAHFQQFLYFILEI